MTDEEIINPAKCAERLGYHYTKGAFNFMGNMCFFAICLAALCHLRKDSTDKGFFDRSGMTVHVDAATGVNYLSDGSGGMVVRTTSEGTPYITK